MSDVVWKLTDRLGVSYIDYDEELRAYVMVLRNDEGDRLKIVLGDDWQGGIERLANHIIHEHSYNRGIWNTIRLLRKVIRSKLSRTVDQSDRLKRLYNYLSNLLQEYETIEVKADDAVRWNLADKILGEEHE